MLKRIQIFSCFILCVLTTLRMEASITSRGLPLICLSNDGRIIAAWEQISTKPTKLDDPYPYEHKDQTGNSCIKARTFYDGEWSKIATLSKSDEHAFAPKLLVNNAGNSVVVWITCCPLGKHALMSSMLIGWDEHWGEEQEIALTDEAILSFELHANEAIGGPGGIVIVWNSINQKTNVISIWTSTGTFGKGWTKPTQML